MNQLFDPDTLEKRSMLTTLIGQDVMVAFTLRPVTGWNGYPERTQHERWKLVEVRESTAVVQRQVWQFTKDRTLDQMRLATGKIERVTRDLVVEFDRIAWPAPARPDGLPAA